MEQKFISENEVNDTPTFPLLEDLQESHRVILDFLGIRNTCRISLFILTMSLNIEMKIIPSVSSFWMDSARLQII